MCSKNSMRHGGKFRPLFALAFCVFSLAALSAQEPTTASPSAPPQDSGLSLPPTSLLWQIGDDALSNSILSFEALGISLSKIEGYMTKSWQFSEQAWQLSVRFEQNMSEVLRSFDSLKASIESSERITTQALRAQKALAVELWVWRAATALSVAGVVYLLLR